jgi:hypothetical protein
VNGRGEGACFLLVSYSTFSQREKERRERGGREGEETET